MPCTDCDDTGMTIQTERACSCAAGDAYRAAAAPPHPIYIRFSDDGANIRKWSWSPFTGAMRAVVYPEQEGGK